MKTNLPCVGCGYNLRTLPVDGRCPECNRPVRAAFANPIWRGSHRELCWTRLGVGLWALAIFMPAVTFVIFNVWILGSASFWEDLHVRDSAPAIAQRWIIHLWIFSHEGGAVVLGFAILAILGPGGTALTNRGRWLRKAVGVIAALGGLGVGGAAAVSYAHHYSGVPAFVNTGSSFCAVALALASIFAWVSLIRRLGQPQKLAAVLLSCVLLVEVSSMLLSIAGGFVSAVGLPGYARIDVVEKWCEAQLWLEPFLRRLFMLTLDQYAASSVSLAAVLALWAYIRVLNRAQRVIDRHV